MEKANKKKKTQLSQSFWHNQNKNLERNVNKLNLKLKKHNIHTHKVPGTNALADPQTPGEQWENSQQYPRNLKDLPQALRDRFIR